MFNDEYIYSLEENSNTTTNGILNPKQSVIEEDEYDSIDENNARNAIGKLFCINKNLL